MSHPDRSSRHKFSVRIASVSLVLVVGLLAACGSDGGKANDTLPPIATTTTTTTMAPTTTTLPSSYVIQPGDTLFSIATMFGLTTDELAVYNNVINQQHIESGQKLKIPPAGYFDPTTIATIATVVPGPESSTTVGP